MASVDPRTWAAPRPSGLRRYVPILTWLPAYDRSYLRFDVVAGATIWGLLVPEMIAYAGLAGLPPQAGLYTLLVTLAAYAVFGTSRHMVVAGTSAAAVLLASTVIALHPAGSSAYATDAAALVLFCGGLFLLAGVLRLGFIAQFLSRPVIEGFVFGLAIFVTVKQLPKLFGFGGGEGNTVRQLSHVIAHLGDTHGATLAVGAGALVLLFAGERWFPKVPGGLLVLVLGIGVSAAFDLSSHGVDVVGHVPSDLPSVAIPRPQASDIPPLIAGAAGMLLVIFSESLGAAQNFASKYGYEIDPNQELAALGVANAGSGLVAGIAAGGSLSQSAVNEGAGARSEISPLVATVLALITVLLLTPLFKDQASRPHVSVLGRVPGVPDAYGDVGRHPDYVRVPGLLVLRLEAPMFYANASLVCDAIKRLAGTRDPLPRAVILDFGANSDLDITSSENLDGLIKTLRSGGIDFGLAEVRKHVSDGARRTGVLRSIGEDHLFYTIDEAVSRLGPAD